MAEDFEITGKSKLVVDESGYFNIKRNPNDFTQISSDIGIELYSGIYFNSPSSFDKLRAVVGKNWDFHIIDKVPKFSSVWEGDHRFKAFDGDYITMDEAGCGPVYEHSDSDLILELSLILI